MKHFAFLEIWVQKQRHHPSLARAQCASLCHGFSQKLLYHCQMPPHFHPPVPQSLSELMSCLSRVGPLGRWIPTAGSGMWNPGALAAQWEPTWSGRPGAFLSVERIRYPLWGPRVRGQSKEPQTCHAALRWTWCLGLCVYRLIKGGSQANRKWNSKIFSTDQHFQELKLRCLFYNTICESWALCPAKGNTS